MNKWMIAANGKMYNHAAAFAKWGYIDWRQRANYSVGDVVYIYCTRPYMRVMYKTLVEQANMSFSECTDDREFWKDLDEYNKAMSGKYARLKQIEQVDREELSLQNLKNHGLKAAPQGPIRVSDELASYLDKFIKDDFSEGVFPESSLPENSYEGAVRTVNVNRYERSSIARQRCIEHYGCKCSICGLDFEEKYGEIGKGFIHVHHIIPLNQIGEEYVVDYEKDLIPVCPNCHAMLHRKINGHEVTIEELKQILGSK